MSLEFGDHGEDRDELDYGDGSPEEAFPVPAGWDKAETSTKVELDPELSPGEMCDRISEARTDAAILAARQARETPEQIEIRVLKRTLSKVLDAFNALVEKCPADKYEGEGLVAVAAHALLARLEEPA